MSTADDELSYAEAFQMFEQMNDILAGSNKGLCLLALGMLIANGTGAMTDEDHEKYCADIIAGVNEFRKELLIEQRKELN